MRIIIIATLLAIVASIKAQTLIVEETDSTLLSEYNDGRLWAYRQIGDIVVGMTNYEEKDDYGKYYLNQRNAKLEIKQGLEKQYLSQLKVE